MTRVGDIIAAASDRLRGTSCVDRGGDLLVLHHATNRPFETFENSSDLGFHFGTRGQAEKRRRNMISRGEAASDDPWRMVSCVLAVRNPLVIAADPGIWGPRSLTATLASFLDNDDRNAIRQLSAGLHSLRGQAPSPDGLVMLRQWLDILKAALGRAGHDGIVYRNVFESVGRGIEWSWLAFDDHQIVRLGDLPEMSALGGHGVEVGTAPRLRGNGLPFRHHQAYGMGELVRGTDVVAFRTAIEGWAMEAGIEWLESIPLDHEPEFGTIRPWFDLTARVGGEEGFGIRVRSASGEVTLLPFSPTRTSEEMLAEFGSDRSEGFFEQGLPGYDREVMHWRPAETLGGFMSRLDALTADFRDAFLAGRDHASGEPGESIRTPGAPGPAI